MQLRGYGSTCSVFAFTLLRRFITDDQGLECRVVAVKEGLADSLKVSSSWWRSAAMHDDAFRHVTQHSFVLIHAASWELDVH